MDAQEIGKGEKLLVLSVDRDDDLGQKAGVKGPVFGRAGILEAANKLGLADPEDTDFNALFEAVRVFDELKEIKPKPAGYSVEVAALTGNKDRGIKAGFEIGRQLDILLKKYKATGVILVTDGNDDEQTIPLIQARVPVKSIKRLIVRQADQLESSYFKIKDFIDESMDNPRFAGLVFGLPAIVLILLGVFGIAGMRYVLLLLGAFLVIKWFRLEKHITGASDELRASITKRRFAAFFVYMLAGITGILGAYRGYLYTQGFIEKGIFESMAAFIYSTVFLFWLAVAIGWFGRSAYKRSRHIGRFLSIPIFSFAVALVFFGAADIIVSPIVSITTFLFYVVLGGALILLSVVVDKISLLNKKSS